MTLGENLNKLRKNRNMTQEQIAILLGIGTNSYQNYELNKRKPNIDMLIKLSKIFEVSIDELILGETSLYIGRLNRHGYNIHKTIHQATTEELIEELNNRKDFPMNIKIKNHR